ncbi:hypothetical protein [Streptosporangium sp. NPDC002607]
MTKISAHPGGTTLRSLTSGVFPIVCSTSPLRPMMPPVLSMPSLMTSIVEPTTPPPPVQLLNQRLRRMVRTMHQ